MVTYRRFIALILILILTILILLAQGASQYSPIGKTENPPIIDSGNPGNGLSVTPPNLPSNGGGLPGGGNLPSGINLPTFPGGNLPPGAGLPTGGFGNPSFSLPTGFTPPTFLPPPGISINPPTFNPPTFGNPTINPPTLNPPTAPNIPNNPNITGIPDINFGGNLFDYNKLPRKAQVLPDIQLNLNFEIPYIGYKVSLLGLLMALVFISAVGLLNQYTQFLNSLNSENFIKKRRRMDIKTQSDEEEITNSAIPMTEEIERQRRLLTFRDHVIGIIDQTELRINKITPSETVILGYYDLETAFEKFSTLRRDVGETPLEHATKSFKEGEINNEALETIVQLFYDAKYGEYKKNIEDVKMFINELYELVPDKPEVEVIENEGQ